jgi:hypothetical protein
MDDAINPLLRDAAVHAEQSTELVELWRSTRPAPDELDPDGWFSSLWALQETYIPPDMLLLN